MFEQLGELGYDNFDYNIDETCMKPILKIDKSKFLPGGSPLYWYEESEVYSYDVLNEGIDFIAKDVLGSREYYEYNLQYCVRQITGTLLDYYGIESGLNNYEVQSFMDNMSHFFDKDNLMKILKPMFKVDIFYTYDERLEDVRANIVENPGAILGEFYQYKDFIESIVDICSDLLLEVANEAWNNNTETVNLITRLTDTLISSKVQPHFPEITLAWCRSLDPNYNNNVTYTDTNTTRMIRINCPVNIEVYDSNNNLVASIIDNVCDNSIQGVPNFINSTDEKVIYLPSDESYKIEIIATDSGKVNYSLAEYNYSLLQNSRMDNYYDILVEKENICTFDSKGELLLAIMSSLAQEESRSISQNVTRGQRKRFADGKVTIPFNRFLGYDKGEDGNLVVNIEQAKIVRKIYRLFLEGLTLYKIAERN